MSDYEQMVRDTVAKSMAVGGELMRQSVLHILREEFAQLADGVDVEGRTQIIIERICELRLP